MNTLQNIYDKLANKTELAKHEVELATMLDFQKMIDDAKKVSTHFDGEYQKLLLNGKAVNNLGNTYISSVEKLEEMQNYISKQFKELGLDWGSTPEKKAYNNLLVKYPVSIIKKIQGGLQQL